MKLDSFRAPNADFVHTALRATCGGGFQVHLASVRVNSRVTTPPAPPGPVDPGRRVPSDALHQIGRRVPSLEFPGMAAPPGRSSTGPRGSTTGRTTPASRPGASRVRGTIPRPEDVCPGGACRYTMVRCYHQIDAIRHVDPQDRTLEWRLTASLLDSAVRAGPFAPDR
jgi:hypothetical protein